MEKNKFFKNHTCPKILHLISLMGSHINNIIIVQFRSYLSQCFKVSQLLKYDGKYWSHIFFQCHVVAKTFQNLRMRLRFSIPKPIKIKLFAALEIQCFELGTFSFNSYVYYVTRGFIARAFNLLTRAVNLPSCAFNLATCAFSLLTRRFEHVTRGSELVTRNSCFTFPL